MLHRAHVSAVRSPLFWAGSVAQRTPGWTWLYPVQREENLHSQHRDIPNQGTTYILCSCSVTLLPIAYCLLLLLTSSRA